MSILVIGGDFLGDMVVILTDYINHKLCKIIKMKCGKTGCPVVYSKRSWSHLQGALEAYKKVQRLCGL